MQETEVARRKAAIHLLRGGKTPAEVAEELGRSIAWVYKWRGRYYEHPDWQALADRSHRPKHCPKKLPEEVRQAIRAARIELEAEAKEPGKLSYIGAQAVQARLRKNGVVPLPSISSIERELRAAKLTQPRATAAAVEVVYPRLHPTRPLQLIQVDIVPRYLPGGPCVSCFNGIDVVSHYPTGRERISKQSTVAVEFLLLVWQEIGLADYTQLDNEGLFSGGSTHPGVLGKAVRLALLVGTQLVFSPFYHPESNGTVERFHQDYVENTWDKVDFANLPAVQAYSPGFFEAYRHSEHQMSLHGRAPADLHPAFGRLPADFVLPDRLPLTVGQVHFIRRVNADKRISVLNLEWDVPAAQPDQGVWATLELTLQGATLRVFDDAPDARQRSLLAEQPFPLKEEVLPLADLFQRPIAVDEHLLFQSTGDPVLYRQFGLLSTML